MLSFMALNREFVWVWMCKNLVSSPSEEAEAVEPPVTALESRKWVSDEDLRSSGDGMFLPLSCSRGACFPKKVALRGVDCVDDTSFPGICSVFARRRLYFSDMVSVLKDGNETFGRLKPFGREKFSRSLEGNFL